MMSNKNIGTFVGVGVGPGDPELLTVKAVKLIREADIVIAPMTEKKSDSVALSIVESYIQEPTKVIHMIFPMVYEDCVLNQAWEDNRRKILSLLEEGKKVVFLTLGDPMLYSTYIYVFRRLKDSGYPVSTVPGVNSFSAIGSYLGYPLTEGDEILSIIPATADAEKIAQTMTVSDSMVFMKVSKNFPALLKKLEDQGLTDKAVMVSKLGQDGEQVVTDLTQIDKNKPINYLSTILVRSKNRISS